MRERSHRLRTALFTLLGMLLIVGSVSSTHAETTLGDGEYVIFYHHDLLGSPTLVSDQHGNTLWHEHSDPYGRAQDRVSETGEEFLHDRTGSRKGYTGHLQDEGTDLVYMKARYYDPQIGRFYSNDPMGFVASNPMMFNRYAYANNNPYRYIDPDGRAAQAAPVVGYAIYGYTALGLGVAASFNYGVNRTLDLLGFGVFSEQSDTPDDSNSQGDSDPADNRNALPTGLVGDQTHPNAGRKKKGTNRHTSGVLTQENGGSVNEDGTGADAWKDFETLTGGNYNPTPEPGTGHIVGDNGVRYRPATETHAPGIEIPANEDKPAEGLHY